ncbi:MAG: hypothetical protein M1818_008202 [Claussenomyces sp. TS43310]|nr:MAG: hypothetical protein M1818_008202 [Claussenomyces sp. TS43310]
MSEYWKSTPKYWCKHCKTYVRDTKLERANHDATPRHQGSIKRFVRDLHRSHDKEEREKERARSEIARLNGLVSGSGAGPSRSSSTGITRGPAPSMQKPTPGMSSRKEQLAQLVDMGVSIPDEYRRELAMEGEWQVISQRVIEAAEHKPDAIGIGVRKRPANDEEEEEEARDVRRKRWESTHKIHATGQEDADLDTLLSRPLGQGKVSKTLQVKSEDIKADDRETAVSSAFLSTNVESHAGHEDAPAIKQEPLNGDTQLPKVEDDAGIGQGEAVVFKKRAKKNIRQR